MFEINNSDTLGAKAVGQRLRDLRSREGNDTSRAQAGLRIGGKFGLNANHLHIGIAQLDGGGDAADQSAAADRDKYGLDVRQVGEDFEADGSLAGNDLFVVVGRHDRVAVLGGQFLRTQAALFAAGTDGDDLRAERRGGFEFVLRSVAGHHDDGLHAQRPRRVGHSLRVIAARIGNDPAPAFFIAKRCDLVVGAAQFEGADGLQVFELEEELALI